MCAVFVSVSKHWAYFSLPDACSHINVERLFKNAKDAQRVSVWYTLFVCPCMRAHTTRHTCTLTLRTYTYARVCAHAHPKHANSLTPHTSSFLWRINSSPWPGGTQVPSSLRRVRQQDHPRGAPPRPSTPARHRRHRIDGPAQEARLPLPLSASHCCPPGGSLFGGSGQLGGGVVKGERARGPLLWGWTLWLCGGRVPVGERPPPAHRPPLNPGPVGTEAGAVAQ